MFKSKPSPKSPAPRQMVMQALTLDYLIEGNLQPSDELDGVLQGGQQYFEIRYALAMAPAQIQPTGSLTTPPFSSSQWMVQHGALVALIPRDDAAIETFVKAAQGKTLSFRAVMYVGSYVIRASLAPGGMLGVTRTAGGLFEGYGFVLAKDVEIVCQSPGTQMGKIAAPWAALNSIMMQGYHPE